MFETLTGPATHLVRAYRPYAAECERVAALREGSEAVVDGETRLLAAIHRPLSARHRRERLKSVLLRAVRADAAGRRADVPLALGVPCGRG